MSRTLLGLLTLVILVTLPSGPTWAQSPPTVTPDSIELTLEPGDCSDATVTVTLGEAPAPMLDVVLMIDVTGSMNEVINGVTRSAEQIVTDIRSLVPDTSFALMTLADYPAFGGSDTDYPYQLDQDFTQDSATLQNALMRISLADGGDNPESYLRALYESQNLNWRDGSRRIVILFGDSFPHDPDPGPDEIEETADDIASDDLFTDLAANNITVLGIYTNDDVADFYQTLAVQTGGQAFHLSDTGNVAQVVQNLMTGTLSNIRTLTLSPTTPGEGWLQWQPTAYNNTPPGETREFDVSLCVPQDTAGGDYNLNLTVTGDGATIGTIPVIIHVPSLPTATSPPATPTVTTPSPEERGGEGGDAEVGAPPLPSFQWWWVLAPIVLLALLGLLWWLLSHRPARADIPRPPTRPDYPSVPRPPMRKEPPRGPRPSDITHGKPRKWKK